MSLGLARQGATLEKLWCQLWEAAGIGRVQWCFGWALVPAKGACWFWERGEAALEDHLLYCIHG